MCVERPLGGYGDSAQSYVSQRVSTPYSDPRHPTYPQREPTLRVRILYKHVSSNKEEKEKEREREREKERGREREEEKERERQRRREGERE